MNKDLVKKLQELSSLNRELTYYENKIFNILWKLKCKLEGKKDEKILL